MSRRDWKHAQPKNLPDAFQLCVDYALDQYNRSEQQIADLMGLAQPWRLYKWVAEANMPTRLLRGFEHACGANYVSRYLAHSNGQLLIKVPTGRKVAATDIQVLQEVTNAAIGAVLAFANGSLVADEAVGRITTAMEGLAWHRANLEKHQQPEFIFTQEES